MPNSWVNQQTTTNYGGINPREYLGCCIGGPGALVDPTGSGYIWFAYGWDTVSQTIPFNNNLSGSGLRVSGINYGFQYWNQDYNRGSLSSTLNVTNSSGSVIGSVTTSHPQTTLGWTNFSNTYPLNSALLSTLGSATLSFTGKDDRFWAGYYGPAVRDSFVRFAYTVDPCVSNPTYSPSCAGFNSIVTSSNQLPYPSAGIYGDAFMYQMFSIQTALSQGGTGLKVHGFDYGFEVKSREPYCGSWDLFFICLDPRDPLARVSAQITDKNNNVLYSVTRDYNDLNSYQSRDYQFRFGTSQQLGNLGSFSLTANTWDDAGVRNMYARIVYTPDQCIRDPLSSVLCPGYAAAAASQTTPTTSTTVATIESTPTTVSVISTDLNQPITTNYSTPTTTFTTPASPSNNTLSTNNTPSSTQLSEERSKSVSTPSTSTLLSIVRGVQANLAATERAATQNAIKEAETASASAVAEAESIAAISQTASISSSLTNSNASGGGLNSSVSLQFTREENSRKLSQEADQQKQEVVNLSSRNPVSDYLETKTSSDSQQDKQQSQTTVKRNVPNNEAAGGVDIALLQRVPPGYELYQQALKDNNFYPPKEIYKNQKVVDNERILRQLNRRSDVLHELMVNEQYK